MQAAQDGMLRNGDAHRVLDQLDIVRDQLAAARRLLDEASPSATTVADRAADQRAARPSAASAAPADRHGFGRARRTRQS